MCHVFETYFLFVLWRLKSRKYWILPSHPSSKECHPLLGIRSMSSLSSLLYINPLFCFVQNHLIEIYWIEHKLISLPYSWSLTGPPLPTLFQAFNFCQNKRKWWGCCATAAYPVWETRIAWFKSSLLLTIQMYNYVIITQM